MSIIKFRAAKDGSVLVVKVYGNGDSCDLGVIHESPNPMQPGVHFYEAKGSSFINATDLGQIYTEILHMDLQLKEYLHTHKPKTFIQKFIAWWSN